MVSAEQLFSLLDCPTEQAWCETFFDLGRRHGFEQALFGVVESKHTALESAFLRSSYSPHWLNKYDTENFHHIDPTLGHCASANVPLIWKPDIFGTTRQKQFYEEACGYGLRSGITFPIHGADGELGVVCFVSDVRADKKFLAEVHRSLASLALIRDYVFESSLRFANTGSAIDKTTSVTPREKECLKWAAVGKSSWEISKILHCSEATIKFHMANIRRKFGVNTSRQAIVKAIGHGTIGPP
jgi:LuxR family quorum-sensing transcriptional regulator LasR